MRHVILLNGSLRGEESSSLKFLRRIHAAMARHDVLVQWMSTPVGARAASTAELQALTAADAVVIAFPLFSYTMPGALTALLRDFWAAVKDGGLPAPRGKVYAVINCGFPEPWIMREAIRVVRNFCARVGMSYRFSIAISTGPATAATMRVPLLNLTLKKAFTRIARDSADAECPELQDVYVAPIIPKAILLKVKESYERRTPLLRSKG